MPMPDGPTGPSMPLIILDECGPLSLAEVADVATHVRKGVPAAFVLVFGDTVDLPQVQS